MKESRLVLLRAMLPLLCLMLMAVTCFDEPEPEPEPDPEPPKKASLVVSPNGTTARVGRYKIRYKPHVRACVTVNLVEFLPQPLK